MTLKKIFLLSVLLGISSSHIIAQNQAPVVENVIFTQRTDGSFIVDVYYDVNDPDGDVMTVSMEVSDDNGTSWNFTCNNITGNVGAGITSGTNKHVVWDFGAEHQQTFGDQFRVKIIADDGFVGTAPQPPVLSSPLNGVTNVSLPPTLSWNVSSGADSYTLQVSTNDLFTIFVYNQSGLTGISQQINDLSNITTYYWRVSATNSYGTSGWSSVWHFTTELGGTGGAPCPSIPIVVYEGKSYNTVLIGSQCWLKENLDVGNMIQGTEGMSDNGIIEKYCHDNDPTNCETYGGLYQWDETMEYVTTEGTQGICPPGWHIPTHAELHTLREAVGLDGNALKAIGQGTGGGAGTNTSGFSALLAGYRDTTGGFYYLGYHTGFWSSSFVNLLSPFSDYLGLWADNSGIGIYNGRRRYGFSVRCLKD